MLDSLLRSSFILVVATAIPACSSDPGGGGDGGGPGAVDASGVPDAPAAVPGSFQLTWGPRLAVPAGRENIECVMLRLGNETPLKVNQIQNHLGPASHHFIIYKVPESAGMNEQPNPLPCQSIDNLVNPNNGVPLMITQKFDETLMLPQGVAFELEANQLIRLEMHYINTSDEPLDIQATTTFIPIAESEFENAADFLFAGNIDVDLPPGASTLGPSYIGVPAELQGVTFFGFTGHEHQWGTNVQVAMAAGANGADTMVYDLPDFNWDEPETVYLDPPVALPEGGGFRLTCDWNNQSGGNVGFGESAGDEMCFFWSYYYPSRGARTCFHSDRINGGTDICCPGNALCGVLGNF